MARQALKDALDQLEPSPVPETLEGLLLQMYVEDIERLQALLDALSAIDGEVVIAALDEVKHG